MPSTSRALGSVPALEHYNDHDDDKNLHSSEKLQNREGRIRDLTGRTVAFANWALRSN